MQKEITASLTTRPELLPHGQPCAKYCEDTKERRVPAYNRASSLGRRRANRKQLTTSQEVCSTCPGEM